MTSLADIDASKANREEKESLLFARHMDDSVTLLDKALDAIYATVNPKSAVKLEDAKMQRADAAVEAYLNKVLKPPAVPTRYANVNSNMISAGDELRQAMTSLWQAQSGKPEYFDQAAGHIDAAAKSLEAIASEGERINRELKAEMQAEIEAAMKN